MQITWKQVWSCGKVQHWTVNYTISELRAVFSKEQRKALKLGNSVQLTDKHWTSTAVQTAYYK